MPISVAGVSGEQPGLSALPGIFIVRLVDAGGIALVALALVIAAAFWSAVWFFILKAVAPAPRLSKSTPSCRNHPPLSGRLPQSSECRSARGRDSVGREC